jgi:pilus assembly protein TadC
VTPVARRTAALVAGVATATIVGLPGGLLPGLVVGVAVDRLTSRLEPLAVRRRRAAIQRDLAVALDLLGACLVAGTPTVDAVRAVAAGVGGDLGAQFAVVLAAMELGAGGEAWAVLTEPSLLPVGRAFARAASSGAPLADIASQLASEHRATLRVAAEAAAQRASVAAVAPLGACFLPAFVLIAVVPVVAGLARTVLG